jgi:hypothetical protein
MSAPMFVMSERCDTCIFRPGNLMDLNQGRLADIIESTDRGDTNVICHKSRSVSGDLRQDAWCKGSVDRRAGQMIRIMDRLGGIPLLTPDGKHVMPNEQ